MSTLSIRFYDAITHFGNSLQPFLLLAMRLYWGLAFFNTGLGKFHNHDNVVQFFTGLGIPFAEASAYLVAFVETVGGLSLALGLLSRLMAIPLIITMCTAFATAHQEALLNVFHDPETFIAQSPFNFLLTSLVVFSFGPGKISFDHLLFRKGA